MLGNDVLSVRLGGIYALQRLAEEYPEQYHIQIMQLFCAFARHPTEDQVLESRRIQGESIPPLREDVEAIMSRPIETPASGRVLHSYESLSLGSGQ